MSSLEAVIAANREQAPARGATQADLRLDRRIRVRVPAERNRRQAVNEAVQRELRAKNMQLARQQNVVSSSRLPQQFAEPNGDQAQDDVKLGNLRNVAKAAIATVAVDSAAGDDSGPRQDSDTSVIHGRQLLCTNAGPRRRRHPGREPGGAMNTAMRGVTWVNKARDSTAASCKLGWYIIKQRGRCQTR